MNTFFFPFSLSCKCVCLLARARFSHFPNGRVFIRAHCMAHPWNMYARAGWCSGACRYDSVTLLFSGIVGFAQYCAANTDAEGAMKIVKMLNELYTIFDALCDTKRIPNIYKVSSMNLFDERGNMFKHTDTTFRMRSIKGLLFKYLAGNNLYFARENRDGRHDNHTWTVPGWEWK